MTELYPIYEFLLWPNCNNNCKFCHQKNKLMHSKNNDYHLSDNHEKLKSIQLVKDTIKNIPPQFHVLLMGGELFDNTLPDEVYTSFMSLGLDIKQKMLNNEIQFLYLNSNLIYRDTSLLDTFLDIFCSSNLHDRIKFTTSFDIKYRYKNQNDRYIVRQNMKYMSDRYKYISRVANCIMTASACRFIMRHIDYIEQFENRYGFRLNLIPYITLHSYMTPSRPLLLKLLEKLSQRYPGYIDTYVNNLLVKQPRILLEYKHDTLVSATSSDSICGHNENFRRVYLDDDRCFICDCMKLKELFN